MNGDDTKDVSLKVRLTEESFVVLVYPIWKKDYDKETDVTIEIKSPTCVPVPNHELGYDTMDDSVGWTKLVAAFADQAEKTDKEESRKYLSELDYPKDFAKCYRLGEAITAAAIVAFHQT